MLKRETIARSNARKLAVQALYQWEMTQDPLLEIESQFHRIKSMKKVDVAYFSELLHQIPAHLHEIDAAFTPFVASPVRDINQIDLIILRIATYELLKRLDVPYKVVINEALKLAKLYGPDESYRFINGVMDKVAHAQRET